MGCDNNETGQKKTIAFTIGDYKAKPQFKLCVYRLTTNPDVYVVRVVGPATSVEVVGGFGVVETTGP